MVRDTYYYDILSVSPTVTVEEISRAYKRQALRCHPDKTNHDPLLTEKFKEMTRAYEVLKDSKQRHIYDKYGIEGLERIAVDDSTPPPSPSHQHQHQHQHQSYEFEFGAHPFYTHSGFPAYRHPFGDNNNSSSSRASRNMAGGNDFFSQVFQDINTMFSNSNTFFTSQSSTSGGSYQTRSTSSSTTSNSSSQPLFGATTMKKIVKPYGEPIYNQQYKGEDIHHQCDVSLSDLVYGKTIKLSLSKNVKCTNCQGYGGLNPEVCKTCLGSGKVMTIQYNNFTQHRQTGSCRTCQGVGIYIKPELKCMYCQASGYNEETKIIKIIVPPGTKTGDKIILKGETDEGRNIIPGDLIVEIRQKPHQYLTRKNDDLYMDYNLDLKTALLGGEIMIADYLRVGQFLKIYINSHGHGSLNGEKIQQGEVLGTINSGEPKVVKGLGMPINNEILNNGGIIIQSKSTNEASSLSFSNFKRGNLYINFHVQLPSINEFSKQELINLQNVLPNKSSSYIPKTTERVIESHLSNIPGTSKANPIHIDFTPSRSSSPGKRHHYNDDNYDNYNNNSNDDVLMSTGDNEPVRKHPEYADATDELTTRLRSANTATTSTAAATTSTAAAAATTTPSSNPSAAVPPSHPEPKRRRFDSGSTRHEIPSAI
ncbi:hypothetical protein KGF56_004852 [Candida oxycetoniae]|uniref:DnaJ-domain-containing protein n=1 Tax=Candida oxycetoniae TaxID=497107 RepID=A0AAI9ST79_9ASCO|nr:uncharacterized protein KGF56_004852 [Candida oxycetoniae]KAI3402282.2 hypothetical protein KGF56_004852 [Candida oxycetoniae]